MFQKKILLTNNDNLIVILLFLFVILIRIPHLLVLSDINDPSWDSASYFSLSSNLASGKGYIIGFKELFNSYLDTTAPYKNEISYICTWFPPVYPVLGALFIKLFGNEVFSLVLLNVLLHSITVIILYKIFTEYLTGTFNIIVCILYSITPMIFSLSLNAMSETTYVVFSILLVYFCIQYTNSGYGINRFLIVIALSSVTLLTRNLAIFNIIGVSLWLVSLRQYKRSFIYSIVLIIIFFAWEIGFSYSSHHHITSRYFTSWYQSYAIIGDVNDSQGSFNGLANKLIISISGFFYLIYRMPASTFLSLFSIIIVFLFAQKNKTPIEKLIMMTIISFFILAVYRAPNERYYIIFIPMLLISLSIMINNKNSKSSFPLSYRILFVALVFLFMSFSYSAAKSFKDTYVYKKQFTETKMQYLDLGINDREKKCMATYPMIVNHLLGNETLILPPNVNTSLSLEIIISQYRIDYMIINSSDTYMINSELYKPFYLKQEYIKLIDYEFILEKQTKDVWVYKVILFNKAES